MPEYHRVFIPGGTFFLSLVTFNRSPILVTKEAREILHNAWTDVNQRFMKMDYYDTEWENQYEE